MVVEVLGEEGERIISGRFLDGGSGINVGVVPLLTLA